MNRIRDLRAIFEQAIGQSVSLRLQAASLYRALSRQQCCGEADVEVVVLVETARRRLDAALAKIIDDVQRDEVTRILASRFSSASDQYLAGVHSLERAIAKRRQT